MDVSVTTFKQHCLEILRRVERTGEAVSVTRRGKPVARVTPVGPPGGVDLPPWLHLRELGGRLAAEAGESVLDDEDFEARR
jgi:prevent-host-death family protein